MQSYHSQDIGVTANNARIFGKTDKVPGYQVHTASCRTLEPSTRQTWQKL